jgi:catechol 2,3-dioxygenase-like lactoylglutathione lyase family enzyme
MLPIDHVTVAGSDLARMQAALAAMGIETVYGGAHRDGATAMALVGFIDGSYLELIAPQPQAGPHLVEPHPWSRFFHGDAGPCAWAVCTDDLDGEVRRLRSAGIAVSGPAGNGRMRPDGVRLEWETAVPGASPAGSFFPFVIHDLTARHLRAFPQGVPASRDFRGIARVVLAVRNLDAAVARYRQAYGLAGAVKQTDQAFGAQLAVPGDAPIVLAQPIDADSWLANRLEQFGEAPCAVLLEVSDADRHKRAAHSRWFDLDIRWFDSGVLGWRLGSVRKDSRF